MPMVPLYVFIDEGGDFNFSPSGSKVYTISATITHCPWELLDNVSQLKHTVLAQEIHSHLGQKYLEEHLCHCFHATEDQQAVRDDFFKIIGEMKSIRAHAVVVRKNRTNPNLREPHKFYPKIAGYLLDYIFKKYEYSKLCIFVDSMPVNNQREIFLKAIKSEIKAKKPRQDFSIFFPKSASNTFLQVSDYINWAIFRKWEKDDERSYDLIKDKLGKPELDLFAKGDYEYYEFKKTK